LRAQEIKKKKMEELRDDWSNQEWPMVGTLKTWKEKRIEKGRGQWFRA
jgi:uncharacterized pyridoxal phosphate-containing UPF0001 family protein